MSTNWIYVIGAAGALLLARNLFSMFMQLGDEIDQGAIYRIIFFHVPAAFTAGVAAFVAFIGSIMYLIKRNLKYDALAASVTEIAVTFAAANLITGMIWGRISWGIWWTWDARLTSMLVCTLMYAAYLMLRRAIEEPTQRAVNSAVLSIFTFPGVIFTYKAIDWFRTQHPQPVLRGDGYMDPDMKVTLYLNWLALLLIAGVLLSIRMRQEKCEREIDALRREAHLMAQ
jgi:heme exporter protein C